MRPEIQPGPQTLQDAHPLGLPDGYVVCETYSLPDGSQRRIVQLKASHKAPCTLGMLHIRFIGFTLHAVGSLGDAHTIIAIACNSHGPEHLCRRLVATVGLANRQCAGGRLLAKGLPPLLLSISTCICVYVCMIVR